MAIRLIDRYPNRVDPASSDYPHGAIRNKSDPTEDDGTPLEQDWANDQAAFFQGLLEAAGITPSGNVDTVIASDYLDALVQVANGVKEVDVEGDEDVTLDFNQYRMAALRLTGTLSDDIDVIVPDTERHYVFINATSGSFTVTVKTSAGAGVGVSQGGSEWLYSDGTDVKSVLGSRMITKVFESSGTYTKSPGLKFAVIEVVGAGGGGGGCVQSSAGETSAGAGAGGGGYRKQRIDASDIGSSETVTIGAGGSGGAAGNNNGTDGGDSSFGSLVTAEGGELGTGHGGSTAGRGSGGRGGGGGSSSTAGTEIVSVNGQTGGVGFAVSNGAFGAHGGSTSYSLGAPGNVDSGDGNNGRPLGGGGSGGTDYDSSSARAGGDGADGRVIVWEYF